MRIIDWSSDVGSSDLPRLNIGGEFQAARADGYYINQRYNDLKSAVFAWYESENHRYNLLTNAVFNKPTSTENGSILNDTLFRDPDRGPSDAESTRLRGTRDERPRHRSEEHTSELQSLMRSSYAVFCLYNKKTQY